MIDAINHLTRLKVLTIRSSSLADPGFLGELKSIKNLALFDWQPEQLVIPFDLTEIAGLSRLKTLSLSATRIDNLSQLQNLTKLEQLHIPFAKLKDLKPLEKMTQLRWLDFDPADVQDFSPLAKLTNLEVLRFGLEQVPRTTKEEIRRMLPGCSVGK